MAKPRYRYRPTGEIYLLDHTAGGAHHLLLATDERYSIDVPRDLTPLERAHWQQAYDDKERNDPPPRWTLSELFALATDAPS